MHEPTAPKSDPSADKAELLRRWRLVLGRFADKALGQKTLSSQRDVDIDRVLEYLYGREYQERGVRERNRQERGAGGETALSMFQPGYVKFANSFRIRPLK